MNVLHTDQGTSPAEGLADGAGERPDGTGAAPDRAGSRPPTRRRSNGRGRSTRTKFGLWSVIALLLLPLLVLFVRDVSGGWIPAGDDAFVARRVVQVFSHRPPLVGQASTAKTAGSTDEAPSHLGPMSYYLLAIPYGISGWSPVGLLVGVTLIVGGSMALVIWMFWRQYGDRGAVASGIALLLGCLHMTVDHLLRPTSSELIVMPLLVVLVSLWSFACGRRYSFLIFAVAASFVLQTSLVVLPLAGLAALAGLATWIFAMVKTRRLALKRVGWIALAVTVVVWVPPLIQQFTSTHGNLSATISYLSGKASSGGSATAHPVIGYGYATGLVSSVLAGVPSTSSFTSFRGSVIVAPLADSGSFLRLGLLALVVLAGAGWAYHRRYRNLLLLYVVAVVTIVMSIFTFAQRPDANPASGAYFVIWLQVGAILVWSAILLTVLDIVYLAMGQYRRHGSVSRVAHAAPLAVAAVLSLLLLVQRPDLSAEKRSAVVSAAIRKRLPVGTYAVQGAGLTGFVSLSKAVTTDLIVHGYDARSMEIASMADEPQRQIDGPMDNISIVSASPKPPGPRAKLLWKSPTTYPFSAGDRIYVWYGEKRKTLS